MNHKTSANVERQVYIALTTRCRSKPMRTMNKSRGMYPTTTKMMYLKIMIIASMEVHQIILLHEGKQE